MAVAVPTSQALSAKLQKIVAALASRNGEYLGTVYSNAVVTLRCDAEGYTIRDWWNNSPAPSGAPAASPPQGIKTTASLTPTTTPAQCDTIAANMITAIKAVAGPVYVTQDA